MSEVQRMDSDNKEQMSTVHFYVAHVIILRAALRVLFSAEKCQNQNFVPHCIEKVEKYIPKILLKVQ